MSPSLWNLTGTSAALLWKWLSISKAIRLLNYQFRGLDSSRDLTIRDITGYWNRAHVALKHHLNQCWRNEKWTVWNKCQWYLNQIETFSAKLSTFGCTSTGRPFVQVPMCYLRDQKWLCVYCWCQIPEGVVSPCRVIPRVQPSTTTLIRQWVKCFISNLHCPFHGNAKFYAIMKNQCFSRLVCFSVGSPAWRKFGLCSSGSILVLWCDAPLVCEFQM